MEPLAPGPTASLALALEADGQAEAAIAILEATPVRNGNGYRVLAQAYAMAGRYNDAADTILKVPSLFGPGQPVEEAARLIRSAPAKVSAPSSLPAFYWWLDFVYAHVGAPERLLDFAERAMQAGEQSAVLWFAQNYAPVRKTERFKKLVREAGLVDYWKVRGWPDLCHPTNGDDFECE